MVGLLTLLDVEVYHDGPRLWQALSLDLMGIFLQAADRISVQPTMYHRQGAKKPVTVYLFV